jgi:hypothetical protein
MSQKTETTYLPLLVPMSDDVRLEMSSELATLLVELDDTLVQKAEAMSVYKSREKGIRNKISEVSSAIKDGRYSETVRCTRVTDYGSGTVTIYRADNGEVVDTSPIEPASRQVTIDGLQDDLPETDLYDQEEENVVEINASKESRKSRRKPRGAGITRETDVDLSGFNEG